MDGKKHLKEILNRNSSQSGFWHGNAHHESLPQLNKYFNCDGDYELGKKLNDTVCWCMPEAHNAWQHPDDLPMFDILGGQERISLNQDGALANKTIDDIYNFTWPDTNHLDFTDTIKIIDKATTDDMAIMSGMWSPFFHIAVDLFGMENYLAALYDEPELIEFVTERICDFYYNANEKLYDIAGDKIDVFFFGNDLGSQLNLLMKPDHFDRFVFPYICKLTKQAKERGYAVAFHSCGAIRLIIPKLIEAGIDILHPVQARARDMEAESLVDEYKDKIIFMGGLDTQHCMPFESPNEVEQEVFRLRSLFGPNFILSPSHECILPVVPPENVAAMAAAANKIL